MEKNENKSKFPILIVEDHPVSRKLLEKSLLKRGYQVTSVENGIQALEQLNAHFFPIVLSDWMMPEMDGPQLCRAIRKGAFPGYVFIILLTAKDSKEDIITGLRAGADDYLTKPINNAELIARLNTGFRILELEQSLKSANEEIRILSITDSLTGCYNRAYLNEKLLQEINRTKRYRHSLSIIMCDIDHFKKINDTHGHLAGDQILERFAMGLIKSVRQDLDWVARYGGEEFIMILPETDCQSALQVAERVRINIEQTRMDLSGKEVHITVSFGVTGFDVDTPEERLSYQKIIEQADIYLYQAKEKGRNQVVGGPL
jgi:diguanylate cyclase (GGDEF)-like protein